ncbi:uncharacterized protein IUM83_12955 [Phytophthora cinnamomi]|uniref:uncharacterized protein n=1 Tax=Phytophthora cinnamomi TaxID=4785 RepID=UPI00355A59DB|nr:hypothetical protein IUM83_12955 [Phytophthora cinnamomi]
MLSSAAGVAKVVIAAKYLRLGSRYADRRKVISGWCNSEVTQWIKVSFRLLLGSVRAIVAGFDAGKSCWSASTRVLAAGFPENGVILVKLSRIGDAVARLDKG